MWSVHHRRARADDKRDLPSKIGYIINGDGAGMLLFADRPQMRRSSTSMARSRSPFRTADKD